MNNEVLHGLFYEEATNDPLVTDYMFQRVGEIDPDTVKFLNDYGVLSYSQSTVVGIDSFYLIIFFIILRYKCSYVDYMVNLRRSFKVYNIMSSCVLP